MIRPLTRRLALAVGALVAVATLSPAAPAQDASVTVVHGIRGEDLMLAPALPVDVEVDGTCLLKNFKFGETAGPLALPAGTYNIKVRLASDSLECNGPIVIDADVPFAAGENATVIAHLDAAGGITASKFSNDTSLSASGARVQFHHTAVAPAVDVRSREFSGVDNPDIKVFAGVTNGLSGAADYTPGTYGVGVFLAGTGTAALGPLPLDFVDGVGYLVYVVGSANNGTLTAIIVEQTLR